MIRAHLDKSFTVLLAGVLAGLVLALAALPAGAGLRARLRRARRRPTPSCPNTLRTPPTAQRSNLYANDGNTLITSFYTRTGWTCRWHEVAPVMRQAIVAAEDARFYQHRGRRPARRGPGVHGQPARRTAPGRAPPR